MALTQYERLKEILLNDTIRLPNNVIEILKSEILTLFHSYFYVEEDKIKIEIKPDNEGYRIVVDGQVDGIKNIKVLK